MRQREVARGEDLAGVAIHHIEPPDRAGHAGVVRPRVAVVGRQRLGGRHRHRVARGALAAGPDRVLRRHWHHALAVLPDRDRPGSHDRGVLPAALSLEFVIPLAFIALAVPLLVDRPAIVAACASLAVFALARGLPSGLGLLAAAAAGIAAGLIAEPRRAA
jgi:hypothetical protein